MSLPTFAENPNICREDAINQILSSIAMEEIGLSHIINAEGEKIQYALGTLTRNSPSCVCIEDILSINKSVSDTLENIIYSQILLSTKMKNAIILENMSACRNHSGAPGCCGHSNHCNDPNRCNCKQDNHDPGMDCSCKKNTDSNSTRH